MIQTHRAVLDSSRVFTSIEFSRNLIGVDGQAYQVEVPRVGQKRSVISHDGVMLPVANTIAALLTRNSKSEFNKDAAAHIYIAIVGKCRRGGSEDGGKQRTKCARRCSPAMNQIGQAPVLEAVFANPRVNLAITCNSESSRKRSDVRLRTLQPASFLRVTKSSQERLTTCS